MCISGKQCSNTSPNNRCQISTHVPGPLLFLYPRGLQWLLSTAGGGLKSKNKGVAIEHCKSLRQFQAIMCTCSFRSTVDIYTYIYILMLNHQIRNEYSLVRTLPIITVNYFSYIQCLWSYGSFFFFFFWMWHIWWSSKLTPALYSGITP